MENQTNTINTTNSAPAFNAGLAYSEFQQRKVAYMIAALTAFLMSAYFVVGYFTGHLRVLEWDGSQWAHAIPALGLVAAMTGYQFFLYAQGDVAGGKKATVVAVFVAVAFSLLSEVGQGMERDNIRMETKSQQSPTYLATLDAIKGATSASYNPYAVDLQHAQVKLAQCEARLAQGKEKHCEGSKARVEAVQQMIASSNESSQQRALALANTAKAMEKDESNYHPLVNLIRETLGASGTIASFLLSLTLISFFEYAFHYLGGQYAKARAYLMQHGYDVTRKLRQPPRRYDGSMTTYHAGDTAFPAPASSTPPVAALADAAHQRVNEYAIKSAEKLATENAKAQYARANAYNVAGDALDSAVLKVSGGFKQSPEQRQNTLNLANLTSPASTLVPSSADTSVATQTYREALRKGSGQFHDQALDRPTPASPPTVTDTVPARPVTVADTVPARSQNGSAERLTDTAQQAETDLYPDWVGQVASQIISPGARDAKRFISQRTKNGSDKTGLTVQEMGRIWLNWQARAVGEGVLTPNPDYSNGKPKYILA